MNLRLAPQDAAELAGLAKETGMPAAMVLRTMCAIARADAEVRKQMVFLAVALNVGQQAARQGRHNRAANLAAREGEAGSEPGSVPDT